MKLSILLALLLIYEGSFSQDQIRNDSLVSEMCKTISINRNLSDSARMIMTFQKHLFPFLAEYPEEKREQIGENIYYRFQRSCGEFKVLLDRLDPPKGDWESITEKPKASKDKKICNQFFKYTNYSYLEHNGDTVRIKIENGYWTDFFRDGTFSKLKLRIINECEFEIEFIESNNLVRKNFSKLGDRYRYQILEKKIGYYDMSVEISGQNRFMKFKLYF